VIQQTPMTQEYVLDEGSRHNQNNYFNESSLKTKFKNKIMSNFGYMKLVIISFIRFLFNSSFRSNKLFCMSFQARARMAGKNSDK
jgi:hypothetical protein